MTVQFCGRRDGIVELSGKPHHDGASLGLEVGGERGGGAVVVEFEPAADVLESNGVAGRFFLCDGASAAGVGDLDVDACR